MINNSVVVHTGSFLAPTNVSEKEVLKILKVCSGNYYTERTSDDKSKKYLESLCQKYCFANGYEDEPNMFIIFYSLQKRKAPQGLRNGKDTLLENMDEKDKGLLGKMVLAGRDMVEDGDSIKAILYYYNYALIRTESF